MDIHNYYLKSGAKPIFRRGGNVGCLCIHGFSAAPTEISWLGDYLHDTMNMTTYSPRLAGHGSQDVDMKRMRWRDWYGTARDGYEILRNQCDTVFVAGISMGGLLALMLSAADDVDNAGAVIIAAPTEFQDKNIYLTRYLKYVKATAYMPDVTNLPEIVKAEQEKRGEPVIGRTHYDIWSYSATAELVTLSQATRAQLSNIKVPLSLIFAEHDDAVPLSSSDYIKSHVSSTDVEQHVLHESRHIITQDTERDTAFELSANFFRRILDEKG